jgi:bifunctional DNA-binding transcriptional regulator/antitoxin component of YhaV-PrlF toxin-antitoxin module
MAKTKEKTNKKLIDMINEDVEESIILKTFNLKNSTELNEKYLKALVATKSIKPINKQKTLTVNKKGSLIITKNIIEEMNFNIGDTFEVKKYGSKIHLIHKENKIDKPAPKPDNTLQSKDTAKMKDKTPKDSKKSTPDK